METAATADPEAARQGERGGRRRRIRRLHAGRCHQLDSASEEATAEEARRGRRRPQEKGGEEDISVVEERSGGRTART